MKMHPTWLRAGPAAALPSIPLAVKRITDDDVVEAIYEIAGDGFCPTSDLSPSLPKRSHAERRRALNRAANKGLVLMRRGLDGRMHVALASEGWRQLRSRAA
jgi:hypothetical protein